MFAKSGAQKLGDATLIVACDVLIQFFCPHALWYSLWLIGYMLFYFYGYSASYITYCAAQACSTHLFMFTYAKPKNEVVKLFL